MDSTLRKNKDHFFKVTTRVMLSSMIPREWTKTTLIKCTAGISWAKIMVVCYRTHTIFCLMYLARTSTTCLLITHIILQCLAVSVVAVFIIILQQRFGSSMNWLIGYITTHMYYMLRMVVWVADNACVIAQGCHQNTYRSGIAWHRCPPFADCITSRHVKTHWLTDHFNQQASSLQDYLDWVSSSEPWKWGCPRGKPGRLLPSSSLYSSAQDIESNQNLSTCMLISWAWDFVCDIN